MKALFITLNGENLYHHNGRIQTPKRRMPRWLHWTLVFMLADILGGLYLLLK